MFKSVTLEISFKPFKQTDPEYIKQVCQKVFQQWMPLIKNREDVSIMLWTGDGSEILDYTGDLGQEFEWAYFMGTANHPLADENDSPALSLHTKKRLYMKNPPVMTYSILKNIVDTFKSEGERLCGCKIRMGATFDIGPEFAISDFKYKRHTEISSGSKLDSFGFVDATALLNADDRYYAAYPNGIPDKTPFGTFLGKQSQIFLTDMGFDYLWLSNGLGFSADPWDLTGKIFDGENFFPEKLPATREKVFEFWKFFREECDFPLETRGTNNSVGIDYATDGVPLYDIYKSNLDITPPPNSPWAALNDNFGLEIMGHMTRICELPEHGIKFRYYIHDPWWVNTPWYDRYNGQPHDIYLPMAISRINENGDVESAESFNILSIDNTFGDMPDCCVYEPLPHILKAEKDCSDMPAPFVWLYPMREYTCATSEKTLHEMYYGDNYICDAINNGFPLNCVVSSDIFKNLPLSTYDKSVIISPAQPDNEVAERLKKFSDNGGKVIYYSTQENLDIIADGKTVEKVCINTEPSALIKAAEKFGYRFEYELKTNSKTPTLTINRSNNAFIFSAYNPNTTTDSLIRFPLGAPVLDCGEVELTDGCARYRFNRCEHRECRVFVKQESGIVSVKECSPVSACYRRVIRISGLENATVYFFPENNCIGNCKFINCKDIFGPDDVGTEPYDTRWEAIESKEHGSYYKAENISGDYFVFMPFKNPY